MLSRPGAVAVIPVKPLGEALGRLAPVLGSAERRRLQHEMLVSVLHACMHAQSLDGVVVVTGDPAVSRLAEGVGVPVVADHDPPAGMNPAVVRGCEWAREIGARRALVLTADLPLIGPHDIDAVVAEAGPAPGVVLVPSADGTGTNAMLLSGPRVLDPQLGIGSLQRHRDQARRRGVAAVEHVNAAIGLDVDTPSDLRALGRADPTWITITTGAVTAVGGERA